MSVFLIIAVILGYFGLLVFISFLTSKKANTEDFFNAKRQSPWYVVAYGMIGASLSGVTFISVPGTVSNASFSYFQMVLGYLLGYLVIALILLPLYYRLNLVSIYSYLEKRFGFWSYKTGAFYFIVSRVIGASFRLFLTAIALQLGLFDRLGVPFYLTVMISILFIWIYTFRGGIKTVIWTDTLQTTFMVLAAIVSVWLIKNELNLSWSGLISHISESDYSKAFFFDNFSDSKYFFKQFFSGAFIAIVMTGLDQDMMQKNLTCKSLKDAQKNILWFSIVLVFINLIFLSLGALLYDYAAAKDIMLPTKTDKLFPLLAFNHFGTFAGVMFLLGIIAATYSSADSALTSLTTSFSVDFLGINKNKKEDLQNKKTLRMVHVGFSILLFIVILLFKKISDMYPDSNVINNLFKAAGYTYGPLLGLYSFGLFTKWHVKDKLVPLVCIIAPVFSFILNANAETWLSGYKFGFEILIVNGLFTFIGLLLILQKKTLPINE